MRCGSFFVVLSYWSGASCYGNHDQMNTYTHMTLREQAREFGANSVCSTLYGMALDRHCTI